MKGALAVLASTIAVLSPALAQSRSPVEYRGMSARTTLNTGADRQTSTVVLRFYNPNPRPVEVRDVRCEFRRGGEVVQKFTVARITVQPGESEFTAPQTVEGSFYRALCKPGKL